MYVGGKRAQCFSGLVGTGSNEKLIVYVLDFFFVLTGRTWYIYSYLSWISICTCLHYATAEMTSLQKKTFNKQVSPTTINININTCTYAAIKIMLPHFKRMAPSSTSAPQSQQQHSHRHTQVVLRGADGPQAAPLANKIATGGGS